MSADTLTAIDLFSGAGGSSQGIEYAGVPIWYAANHSAYALGLHERYFRDVLRRPDVEHFVADLVDEDAKSYIRPEDLPRADFCWASPSCFPAGTLILVKRGLVPIEDVTTSDEAWTHMQRWRPVSATMQRTSDTVILSGEGHRRLEVTPNHGIWARSHIRTHERGPDPLLPHDCPMCGEPCPPSGRGAGLSRRFCTKLCGQRYRDLRNGRALSGAFRVEASAMAGLRWATPTRICGVELPAFPPEIGWWWLGRWLGDGWYSNGEVIICAGKHEAATVAGRLGHGWRQRETATTINFILNAADHWSSSALGSWLVEQFGKGAINKTIPAWLLALPLCDQRQFLEGYVSADGHRFRGTTVRTSSVSKALTLGVRLIAANLGFSAGLQFSPKRGPHSISGRAVKTNESWSAQWVESPTYRQSAISEDDRLWSKVGEVKPGRTMVDVFNITVDEDHTYVADGIVVYNCTNHSSANATKAYAEQKSLFDMVDPEYDERVTHSERSRATAVCVLRYVARHMPRVVAVENVIEFANWGERIGSTNKGDGSTFRWWLGEFAKLGYHHRTLWLNSMFFGAPQSRDRMYVVFWHRSVAAPDLEHRPAAWCERCDRAVEAQQAFKARQKSWPLERWGRYGPQYLYACPACGTRVEPATSPAYEAIDWSDLGTRIGDRAGQGMRPLSSRTTERIRRGALKFADCPPLIIPCQGDPSYGKERPVTEPFTTQTTRQDKALVTQGVIVTAAGNTFERAGSDCRTRSLGEPMFTQHATPAFGVAHRPFVLTTRGWGEPGADERYCRSAGEPLSTIVAGSTHQYVTQAPPVLVANNGGWDGRIGDPVDRPMRTGTAHPAIGLAVPPAMWVKNNGGPDFAAAGAPPVDLDDVFYRMLHPHEIRAAMAFDPRFQLTGSKTDQVRALGNGVTPPVAMWITERLIAVLRPDKTHRI